MKTTLRKNGLWILTACLCLIFLLCIPSFAQDYKTEIQLTSEGSISGYLRDNTDWDKLVSGTLLIRDSAEGTLLASHSFTADQFRQEYSDRYGDGWHYFQLQGNAAAWVGKTIRLEIQTEEGHTLLAPKTLQLTEGEAIRTSLDETVSQADTSSQTTEATNSTITQNTASTKQDGGTNDTGRNTEVQTKDALNEPAAETGSRYTASDGTVYQKGSHQGSFKLVGYTGGGTTHTGTKATAGRTVAADPEVLPLGSKIILNDTVYTVEDVGSGVQGQMVDIYFDTYEEAYAVTENGWQYAEVWLAVPEA